MVFRRKLKIFILFLLIVLAMFSAFLLSIVLLARLSEKPIFLGEKPPVTGVVKLHDEEQRQTKPPGEKKESARFSAPVILQKPELPRGCEITSLAMLLNYYGIKKSKMELVPEMPVDPTPIQKNAKGEIVFWGHPNRGFVGDIAGKGSGYGIYHGALFKLLESYVPTAVDMTGMPFELLEKQISQEIPVIVWTTVNYTVPKTWVQWNTPLGPFKATFLEHAVLMVGYDKDYVYVNDPLSGNRKVPKAPFIASWEAMGKQALSYTMSFPDI